MGAKSIPLNLQVAPKMAETMAAYYAIQFCQEAGFYMSFFRVMLVKWSKS
jgi:hypothetical protein